MTQLAVLHAAQPHFANGGSATLVTAASARAAMPGTVGLAVINGALECAIPVRDLSRLTRGRSGGQRKLRFARERGFIIREERTFMEVAHGTFGIVAG